MKILEPSTEYLAESITSKEHHFARCARICYASEKGDDKKLYENLWKQGHRSMYRHISRYFKIPLERTTTHINIVLNCSPFLTTVYDNVNGYIYVSTNEQYARENIGLIQIIKDFEVSPAQAHDDEGFIKSGVLRYTFVINTGIDITRELNRVSPNNIAEQSTRYVDFNKKIGVCFKKCNWMHLASTYKTILYMFMCKVDEWFYKISRSKYGLNLKPQDARWCLFLDTQSKAAYTYSFKEWQHILDLRYHGTTGAPHPDAKNVAYKIWEWFYCCGYKNRI